MRAEERLGGVSVGILAVSSRSKKKASISAKYYIMKYNNSNKIYKLKLTACEIKL
jgi:hypothetical protein